MVSMMKDTQIRAAVVGGGIAGMVAAWELVRAGVQVELYEAADRLGGAIGTHQLAGVEFDAGAEAFATRSRAVPDLIQELELQDQVVEPNAAGAWLQLPDCAAPLPATGILGIPADPQARDVVRILGEGGARRAAEDLKASAEGWIRAAERGERPSLGAVVRDRMGEAVLRRLVTPIVSGVHSADPEDLDMETAAPGLFEAMLREGSLAEAVAAQKAQAPAGAAVNSLAGGLSTLVTELETQLRERGVRVHPGCEIRDLQELARDAGPPEHRPAGAEAMPDHVVLAVDGPAALQLAGPVLAGSQTAPQSADGVSAGRGVALVSMVLHAPELDSRPRGTGMLVAPSASQVQAKAMTHVSAKWEWVSRRLRAGLGEGHHLVRLSYGRVTDDPATGALGYASQEHQLREAAVEDAGRLFGVELGGDQVLDSDVIRWRKALPQTSAGHRERTQAVRESLRRQRRAGGASVAVVGSWFAGTGLARVIPDARRTVAELLG